MLMTNTLPFGAPSRFLDVGHSQVPYFRVGRGPDVLFIHGWPLHAATFRDSVPLLSDRFTCHLIDLPGSGESKWDASSKISLSDHARTVRAVVDQLKLSRYAVVAHDSGAVIARLLAAEDDRITGLVLGNSEIPGHRPWQLGLYLALNRVPFGATLFGLGLRFRALRHSALAFGGCFHDPRVADGEFRDLFLRPLQSPRVFAGERRLLSSFDWRVIDGLADVHARIRAPVKLVWGAQDPYFPLEKVRSTLNQFAGGATLSVIDPGKLFWHEEFAERFARETEAFLEVCAAEASRAMLSTA